MTSSSTGVSIQDAVYNEIRKAIMTLKLVPGTVISTQEIATKLNVSRTPVREAFIRLSRENLLDVIPQKETNVSRINIERVEQERFVRESLEVAIISDLIEKCRTSDIMRLRASIEEQEEARTNQDFGGFLRHDDEFHSILFEVSGQKLAWEIIQNTNSHYNRIRMLSIMEDGVSESVIRQHRILVGYVECGDGDRARAEVESHVRKLKLEKDPLKQKHPDYFLREDVMDGGVNIGTLC